MTQSQQLSLTQARECAARIAAGIERLEARGLTGKAFMDETVIYLPDLKRIWYGTSDNMLATLCHEYPAFYRYAAMMEEGAELERQHAAAGESKFADLRELPEPVKGDFARLLADLAVIEHGMAHWKGAPDTDEIRGTLMHATKAWQASVRNLNESLAAAALDPTAAALVVEAVRRLQERMDAIDAELCRADTEVRRPNTDG